MGTLTLEAAANLNVEEIARLSEAEIIRLLGEVNWARNEIVQSNPIYYYEPANSEAERVHLSGAKEIIAAGGNRSSKTETLLAEITIRLTGIIPKSLEGKYPKEKIVIPCKARTVGSSFIDTVEKVLKPKLQWWKWTGSPDKGHWGWIPRSMLIGGDWAKSFSEKHRMLTLSNGSSLSFMSYDQEPVQFSGDWFHIQGFDELPPEAIYRECKMRTLDVGGQMITAMTPPDDSTGLVAWIADNLYSRGLPGPDKDPDMESFTLFTENNRFLSLDDIQRVAKGLTPEQRAVRLYGKFMHLFGLVYPLFTDMLKWWCFDCEAPILKTGETCPECQNANIVSFCHMTDWFAPPERWPVLFFMDPHPRTPLHAFWVAVDDADDWWIYDALIAEGTVSDWKKKIDEIESKHVRGPEARLCDPNALEQGDDRVSRGWTLRRELDSVGLRVKGAVDNFPVGRTRLNEALKPDRNTGKPRLQIMRTERTVEIARQIQRHVWDEFARQEGREPKQKPKEKNKHFPDLLRYLANEDPSYRIRFGKWIPRNMEGRSERTGY